MIYNHAHGRPLTDNLLRNSAVGAGAGALAGLGYGLLAAGSGAGAAAIPTLTAGAMPNGREMLGQAIQYLQQMGSSGRVEAFRNFAQQIATATRGAWQAAEMQGVNATIFAGRAGEALVFDAQGLAYRGNVANAEQFTRTAQGLVANFDKLTQVVR